MKKSHNIYTFKQAVLNYLIEGVLYMDCSLVRTTFAVNHSGLAAHSSLQALPLTSRLIGANISSINTTEQEVP